MFGILASCFPRAASAISRFRAATHAASATEFALLTPFFLGTFIAIFETSLYLFAQQTLQNAASSAGRLLMTGQVQNSSMTQAQFTNQICPLIQPLLNCSNLMVDVENYGSFIGANTSAPTLTFNAQGQVNNSWAYSPGTPGQVMVVRLIYQWPVVGALLGFNIANLSNGNAEVMGVSAFRVEPYQ
jgi:Flp pilus assembly protein TadG